MAKLAMMFLHLVYPVAFGLLSSDCKIHSRKLILIQNKSLPIKVNIFAWRLRLDRLPARINLDGKGIDMNSCRCHVCDGDIEDSKHRFIGCLVACNLRMMIMKWWRLPNHPKDLPGLLLWSDLVGFNIISNLCFDVVVQTTFCVTWRYSNSVRFDSTHPRKDILGVDIKILSHSWILHRNNKVNPNWLDWLSYPLMACNNLL
ncbi:reverse transcriptase domain, Reverse transcriptase zinc-binding domain protein [Artemisia annua]|uniref:Reverse transcriptase domain, Reverse transcriptase zinc-binding domain protein n=1 Tax=Artemisia annua TaxID=35608 RepID=A0A2U1LW58_ARTAN|nr:reverse transcriptase domain, Reverse transcriptase zinc-binding domain protein [Artemisia annua]